MFGNQSAGVCERQAGPRRHYSQYLKESLHTVVGAGCSEVEVQGSHRNQMQQDGSLILCCRYPTVYTERKE